MTRFRDGHGKVPDVRLCQYMYVIVCIKAVTQSPCPVGLYHIVYDMTMGQSIWVEGLSSQSRSQSLVAAFRAGLWSRCNSELCPTEQTKSRANVSLTCCFKASRADDDEVGEEEPEQEEEEEGL